MTGNAAPATVESMPDDLYEKDILAWSERQAELLSRAADTERHGAIDWSHVIDEITAVGTAQLNDARGLVRQAMICLVRMHLDRNDTARDDARLELNCVLDDAAEQVTPSMTHRIDLALIWSRIRARAVSDDPLSRALPDHCPWTVEALLAHDHDSLLGALAGWPLVPDSP